MYQIENNQVFYTKPLELRLRLKTAHVQHFQPLKDRTISAELTRTITQYGCWHRLNNLMAKDDRTVWFGNQPVPGADPESFVYYHGGECAWGQDKNQLYCFFDKGRHNIKTIKSKNPASFGFFDFPETIGYLRMYAFDEHHVYHLGQRVRKAHPNAFRPLTKKSIHWIGNSSPTAIPAVLTTPAKTTSITTANRSRVLTATLRTWSAWKKPGRPNT